MRPLSSLQRKPDIYMIYDGHSPYASYETSLLITLETFNAVPNREYTINIPLYAGTTAILPQSGTFVTGYPDHYT